MNPLTIKLLAGAAALALAFGAGWGVNGWRLHADLADQKADRATEIGNQYKDAATDLAAAADVVKEAAIGNRVDMTALTAKLDALDRRTKNAPPPPLPLDCKPGPVRLRNLAEAAAAVDATINRPVPGR